jgi:hypothetical protein
VRSHLISLPPPRLCLRSASPPDRTGGQASGRCWVSRGGKLPDAIRPPARGLGFGRQSPKSEMARP